MMNLDELYYKYYSNHIEKQYSNNTRIKLIPLTDQALNVYLDNLIEYSSVPSFYKYLEFSPIVTKEDIVLYYKNKLNAVGNKEDILWIIVLIKGNKAIGTIRLTNIDFNRKNTTIGYGISPTYCNKGYFTEALRYVVDYSINEFGFYRIEALTRLDNVSSIKGLEKVGFVYEGLLRQYQLDYMNNRHDVVIYSLLTVDIKK